MSDSGIRLPTLPKEDVTTFKTEEIKILQETLDRLVEELTTLEAIRETFNQVIANNTSKDEKFKKDFIQYFNVFSERTDRLLEKVTEEFNYSAYLQQKVANNELSSQVTLLEQQLQNEKTTLNIAVKNLEETTSRLEEQQEKEYSHLQEKLDDLRITLDERIRSYNDIDGKLEKSLNDFRKSNVAEINRTVQDIRAFTEKQHTDTNKSLVDTTKKAFEEIKEYCVNFLKECSKEAAKAAKHAVNSGKLEKKDKIVIITCGIVIINELMFLIPYLIQYFNK
ncbi:MAG: hypothetical protein K5751_07825 [Treponemataceae bacterium]|nr:hypothetical protein [Treponemataceae bacterium]